VMTATPIPRTLAMVGYADLDVSVIDELPPGRKPIQTVVVSNDRRPELIERIEQACASGRQAYWVCTLIEESDLLTAQAAEAAAELLELALPNLRIGLVHGRLKAKEKDAVMQDFAAHRLDVLVATTVIEVGVDVPNASLMLIENAERLGLSQLHQLRGRVGRGNAQSSCVLIYQGPLGQNAKARLSILRDSTDGFVIAERDLELRGPGELLGTKQTGDARFRIADLNRDLDLLETVREISAQFAHDYPKQSDALVRRWIGAAERYAHA
jgi:ATP-dependent DNA helicase RecG